ncbi:putative phytoene dehydrogenase [Actinacidiphila reveromycinica]|uniref:Putative phytoene dehydrogenase n=1 Tax=Actinacidiphila reveromycinica TaxID=659352 RepID=A0A7U3VMM8_9ACTN|nr:NAD(P)/FAD-dependent oxidoreductase [Streptomyces sp. SN-593]BBA96785.1 putative phytoene dehydrogenase [Streptomyces sp. SN-593]
MGRIAVVGAGMAAMAVAARLATGGHEVVVHERAETYGGAVGRYTRDGFAFDTGPGLLVLPAVYRDLFVKTGREPLEECVGLAQVDPAGRHLFADGTGVSLPNASRSGVIGALDAAFGPGGGERWSDVLVRAREVWEGVRRPLLEEPAGDPGPLARDPYPGRRRGLRRRPPYLAEVAADELGGDPRAAALLEWYALAYGLDPRTAPAAAAVLPYLEQSFGLWYVRGGMRALADALHARCRARKVEFRFGSEVAGVEVRGGEVQGLRFTDGSTAAADVVAASVPLPYLPQETLPAATGDPLTGARDEPGRCTVHVALRGSRPAGTAHRTVVHAADRGAALDWVFGRGRAEVPAADALTVGVLRPDDPAGRPDDGHEAVTVTATVPRHATAGARHGAGRDWSADRFADAFAERMLQVAERAVPGLRERELWREVRTPLDVERETGAAGGSVPVPSLPGAGGALLRPPNRTALKGLYFLGGWAHPGGGLPHAGMSAAIVADLVAGGPGGSR